MGGVVAADGEALPSLGARLSPRMTPTRLSLNDIQVLPTNVQVVPVQRRHPEVLLSQVRAHPVGDFPVQVDPVHPPIAHLGAGGVDLHGRPEPVGVPAFSVEQFSVVVVVENERT